MKRTPPAEIGLLVLAVILKTSLALAAEPVGGGLAIANKGTANPVLLYDGRPMLRIGCVSETALFAFPWDCSEPVLRDMPHAEWAAWQQHNSMGYARAYLESGFSFGGYPQGPKSEKILPWKVDHWNDKYSRDGEPVVDLNAPNADYWSAFENTLQKCKEHDIVVIVQLYQACYFGVLSGDKSGHKRSWWQMSFFHPQNNINGWPIGTTWKRNTGRECGNDFMQRCVDDYHGDRNSWWRLHADYVGRILGSIGDNGNVLVDLGNELGYPDEGFHCYEWVERTLDMIEAWETQHGVDILVGMDEHFWFRVAGKSDWVRKHPRLEVLIFHGGADVMHDEDWDHRKGSTPRDAGRLRKQHRKPCVTIQNHFLSKRLDSESAALQRAYHWLGMMQKVQGLASYGYGRCIDDDSEKEKLEQDTRFLMGVYGSLKDYTSLISDDHSGGKIAEAPGYVKYKYLLSSRNEALFYTHTEDFGVTVPAGQILKLYGLPLSDGPVRVKIIKPHDRTVVERTDEVDGGTMEANLPPFTEDIAVHIEPMK